MKKLAIIHFNILEYYPPAMNFINILSNKLNENFKVIFITNKSNLVLKNFSISKIEIIRTIKISKQTIRIFRLIKYIYFNLFTLFRLVIYKPDKILYYETHSSYPVYFYKKYVNKNVRVFIHYHEYMTPKEYSSGMKLLNFYHKKEKYIYNKAKWISLTNDQRVRLFFIDNPGINNSIVNSLPNFPLKTWLKDTSIKKEFNSPLKIVFVGSLSNETMFYKEFAEWVLKQNGNVIWDIYSQQISTEVLTHIKNLGNGLINFKGYVNYYELNEVLYNYDIGVILYRGLVPNFKYNATNKLFEYLACGLDVWVPEELVGAHDYLTKNTYPKVVKIDFKTLAELNLAEIISRKGLEYKPSQYFAEDVYKPFINLLLSDD